MTTLRDWKVMLTIWLETQVVVLKRVHDQLTVDGAGHKLVRVLYFGAGPIGRAGRLCRETPDITVLAARMALGLARFQVPFGDGGGVADAEEARLSNHDAAIAQVLVGLVDPDEAVNAAALATPNNLLLVPGAVAGVPYLDIAVGTANRQPRDSAALCGSRLGMGEGDRVDSGRLVGDEAAAVNVHGCRVGDAIVGVRLVFYHRDGASSRRRRTEWALMCPERCKTAWLKGWYCRGPPSEHGGKKVQPRPRVFFSAARWRSRIKVWSMRRCPSTPPVRTVLPAERARSLRCPVALWCCCPLRYLL